MRKLRVRVQILVGLDQRRDLFLDDARAVIGACRHGGYEGENDESPMGIFIMSSRLRRRINYINNTV